MGYQLIPWKLPSGHYITTNSVIIDKQGTVQGVLSKGMKPLLILYLKLVPRSILKHSQKVEF